jgi:hypothetical protein
MDPRVVIGKIIVIPQSMQVVKGDWNEYPVPGGVQLGHPAPGVINTVDWPSRLGDGRQALTVKKAVRKPTPFHYTN